MAVIPTRERSETTMEVPDWEAVDQRRVVALGVDEVNRLMRDVPAWRLWHPAVIEVDHEAGEVGEPGMVCRVSLGTRRASSSFVHMLMASSASTTVFAGGRGRDWRYVDVVQALDAGGSTTIRRRVELRLAGPLRFLRRPIRALARRVVRRSLASLG